MAGLTVGRRWLKFTGIALTCRSSALSNYRPDEIIWPSFIVGEIVDLHTFKTWSDTEQHDYLSGSVDRILRLDGMDKTYYPDILMEYEVNEDDQIYMRMMSRGGHSDHVNCTVLKTFLRDKKLPFDSTSDRNVIMTMTNFLTVF